MTGITPKTKEIDLAEFGAEGKWTIKAMGNGMRKKMKLQLAEIGKREGYSLKDLADEDLWDSLLHVYGDDVLTEAISECVIAGPGVVDGKLPKEVLDEFPQEIVLWIYNNIEEISKFPLVQKDGAGVNNAPSQPIVG